jgi:hypothetical protein
MKNIINILYNDRAWDNAERLARSAAEKEAAIAAVIEYSGLDPDGVVVDFARLSGDGEDRTCQVDFRYIRCDDVRRCGMSWTAYVDMTTGEVVGFAGSTERGAIDMEEPA